MKRSLVVLLSIALAGCGFDAPSSQSGSSNNGSTVSNIAPTGTGVAPVAAAIPTNTASVKVVLKTSRAVESFVGPVDAEGSVIPQDCTSATTCVQYNAAATCSATSLKCVITTYVPSTFYVLNQTPSGNPLTVSFPVPCDGKDYQVDLYSKTAAADANGGTIVDVQTTPTAFKMTVSGTTCTAPTNGIGLTAGTYPTVIVPTIYAGLPSPLNVFKIAVRGNSNPWASKWTVSATGATQDATDQTKFTAPTTAGNVVFTALFNLDSSLFVGSDTAADWQYALVKPVAAVATVNVTN